MDTTGNVYKKERDQIITALISHHVDQFKRHKGIYFKVQHAELIYNRSALMLKLEDSGRNQISADTCVPGGVQQCVCLCVEADFYFYSTSPPQAHDAVLLSCLCMVLQTYATALFDSS